MKEIRIDSITNDVVVFATDRSKRPVDKMRIQGEEKVTDKYKAECPFCRYNKISTSEETFKIEGEDGWLVKSLYNKFPIVDNVSNGIYGIHEVMIDTYRHEGSFYDMDEREYENLFTMYIHRYNELIKDNKIKYVSIFKNYLRKAGASLAHPHSQIISLSVIPPEINNEVTIAKEYYNKNHKSLYAEIIENEIRLNERVVYNGEYFLVFIPYATKYNGEIRIFFKENITFEELNRNKIKELSYIAEKLFKAIYDIEGDTPFNLCIHTHPKNIESKEYFNVHIHIIPRKYSFGGFELGNGIYVSSTKPEDLAKKLRF